jgi:hypothetical protein
LNTVLIYIGDLVLRNLVKAIHNSPSGATAATLSSSCGTRTTTVSSATATRE